MMLSGFVLDCGGGRSTLQRKEPFSIFSISHIAAPRRHSGGNKCGMKREQTNPEVDAIRLLFQGNVRIICGTLRNWGIS